VHLVDILSEALLALPSEALLDLFSEALVDSVEAVDLVA
jgi:hypothetical protein